MVIILRIRKMIAHRVSQLAPDSEAIPLAQMPQQVGVRKPEDDWTGVISQNERRKLQNRLNQRAYRSRKQGNEVGSIAENRLYLPGATSSMVALNSSTATPEWLKEEDLSGLNCARAPPNALKFRQWFESMAYRSYINGHPSSDHLISLSRINVHRAIDENIALIGMTPEWLKSDDSISIFNLVPPGFDPAPDRIPSSLRPTAIQRRIPHHPWLDFFPFPGMRDRMILAGDTFDDDDLCHDLMAFWDTRNTGATLLVWGEPWDPRNWEVTESFAAKWPWLLRDSPELLASTNSWRMSRGEKLLIWNIILCTLQPEEHPQTHRLGNTA